MDPTSSSLSRNRIIGMLKMHPKKILIFPLVSTWMMSIVLAKGPYGIGQNDIVYTSDCRMTHDGQEYFYPKEHYDNEDGVKPCKPWSSSLFNFYEFEEKDLRENYCRNPGDHTEPYCFGYISDEKQSCQIAPCPILQSVRTSQRGQEYVGNEVERKQTGCEYLCLVHEGLGLACQTDIKDFTNKEWYEVWVPCDIPMLNETLVKNTTFRTIPRFIPLTTWYVHPSPDRINYLGPGEMLIRLPDTSGLENPQFLMKFRIRLPDLNEAKSFHLNINLLPDDSFTDYYNLTFARKEIEIQRIYYKNITIYNSKEKTEKETDDSDMEFDEEWPSNSKEFQERMKSRDDKEDEKEEKEEEMTVNRTEIRTRIESSGKYKKTPWIKMRYEWVEYVIEFNRARIALHHANQTKPFLELKVPYHQFGATEWKFQKRYLIGGYKTPKYINFHSHNGTVMIAIDEVNGQPVECIEGQVKKAINNTIHLLPMSVMPVYYFDDDDPTNYQLSRYRPRFINLKLNNIPANVLFTSGPLYDGIRTTTEKDIMGLFITVSKKDVLMLNCAKISKIEKSLRIQCDPKKGKEYRSSLPHLIPNGADVIISILNYIEDGLSVANVSLQVGELKPVKLTIIHPVYLRYWTIAKEEATVSETGPLEFALLSEPRCNWGPSNTLLSKCLTSENKEDFTGQISQTKTGKSCIPWAYFDGWLVTMLFGDSLPPENYCSYLPEDEYDVLDENTAKKKKEEKKEKEKNKKTEASFWCFVTLGRQREKCEIPLCRDVAEGMNCGITPEYKECEVTSTPLSKCMDTPLCNEINAPIFFLTLNTPSNEVTGLKNQILYAEEGIQFLVKSYSTLRNESLCVYLYHKETYPVAKFIITNSTLSLGYQGVPWYDLKALTLRNSYYLNTWSYNSFIIIQSENGWHLFHGGNLYPAITYYTAQRLYAVRFSSCEGGTNSNATGQMVVISVLPQYRATMVTEVLMSSANPTSGDKSKEGIAEVDRFYPIGKRYDTKAEEIVHLTFIRRSDNFQLNVKLYKQLPWPSASSIAQFQVSQGHIRISTSSSENKRMLGQQIGRSKMTNITMSFKFFNDYTDVKATVTAESKDEASVAIKVSKVRPRYYGMEVERGSMEITMY